MKAFTLIELLIVMAVMGVLASIAIIAVNPQEQLAKAQDSKTKQSVTQLGGSLSSYFSSKHSFPVSDTLWMDDLIDGGDLSSRPSPPTDSCNPVTANDTNFCLQVVNNASVVYARMSSKNESSKCSNGNVSYFLYDTSKGRSCIVCGLTTDSFTPGVTCNAEN